MSLDCTVIYLVFFIVKEKKCKKATWLSGAAFQTAVRRREAKSKGEKEKIQASEYRVPKSSKER